MCCHFDTMIEGLCQNAGTNVRPSSGVPVTYYKPRIEIGLFMAGFLQGYKQKNVYGSTFVRASIYILVNKFRTFQLHSEELLKLRYWI